jgi:hypothetical protein
MSILRTLLRFVDPIAHRQKTEEERRKAATPAPRKARDPEARVCRVCAYEGTGRFCPRCLAETMEPARNRNPPR